MSDVPRVTIAVPTFNRPNMLESCLSRLLGQISSDVEIYVSDNASDSETAAVLAKFCDSRLIKSRNSSNIGLFPNLNHCLSHAAGMYTVFLSDDDFIDDDFVPSCLALLEHADAEPDCPAIIAANRYLINTSDGQQRSEEPLSSIETGFYDGDFLIANFLRGEISLQLCGVLFRTDALKAIGGFNTDHKFTGDLLTYAELFLNKRVGFLSSPKCTYVLHPNSETNALGMRYRMADLENALIHIIAMGKQKLPSGRSEELTASARRHLTKEYLSNVMGLYRAGSSRRHCLMALIPAFHWMLGHGGRLIFVDFIFEAFFPLKLKEFCWTIQRLRRQLLPRLYVS